MAAKKQPSRGRPTQSELEDRKVRVLQIAESLFMTRGYAGTSVSEISKRSRVSPRMITAHFGDKSEIFSAVINDRSSRAFIMATEAVTAGSLEDILFGVARFAWAISYTPQAVEFQRLVVGEGSRFASETSRIARKVSDHFFSEVEAIFLQIIEKGMIKPGDHRLMAKYFVDLTIGFSLIQAGMGYWDRVPDEDELRDKVRFFCRSAQHFEEIPVAPLARKGCWRPRRTPEQRDGRDAASQGDEFPSAVTPRRNSARSMLPPHNKMPTGRPA